MKLFKIVILIMLLVSQVTICHAEADVNLKEINQLIKGKYTKGNISEVLYFIKLGLIQTEKKESHIDDIVQFYEILYLIYKDQKIYHKSEEFLNKVLYINQKKPEKDEKKISKINSQLGEILRLQGKYEKAKIAYYKSLQWEKNHKVDHPERLAVLYNNISHLYTDMKNYQKAREYLEKSLSLYKIFLEPNDLKIVKVIFNIGKNYLKENNIPEAEKHLLKAYSIVREKYGKDSKNSAYIQNQLALLYQKSKDYQLSYKLFKSALNLARNHFGSHSELTLNIQFNTADLMIELGELERADTLLTEILVHQEKTLGEFSLSLVKTLEKLALVYEKGQNYEKAEFIYQRMIKILQYSFGEDHIKIASAYEKIGHLYIKMNNINAEIFLNKALTLYELNIDRYRLNFDQIIIELSRYYEKKGNQNKVIELMNKKKKWDQEQTKKE